MGINKENYKDWLIRYFEDDLSIAERIEANQFIKENEWAKQELDLLKRTRLEPDMEIRFPNKRLLFRTEEPVVELKKPVVVFRLYRYAALAAAAAFLAFAIIISISKQGNNTETAHSGTHNNIIPSSKLPQKSQVALAPETAKVETRRSVLTNTGRQKHILVKKDLMANEKKPSLKEQQLKPVQEKNTKVPDFQPTENKDYALNKTPVEKQADLQTTIPIKKEVAAEPAKQIAAVKQSEPAIPSKYASYGYSEDKSTLQSLLDIVHKVSIKKRVVDQQTYYALSIETPDIKINKTIK